MTNRKQLEKCVKDKMPPAGSKELKGKGTYMKKRAEVLKNCKTSEVKAKKQTVSKKSGNVNAWWNGMDLSERKNTITQAEQGTYLVLQTIRLDNPGKPESEFLMTPFDKLNPKVKKVLAEYRNAHLRHNIYTFNSIGYEKDETPVSKGMQAIQRLERAADMDAVDDKLKEIQSDVSAWKSALKAGSGEANSINSTIENKVGNLRSFIVGIKGNKRWTPDEDDKKKLDKIDTRL